MRRFYSMERRFKTAKSAEILLARDLFRKPEPTSRDHAPNAPRTALMIRCCVGSSR
jgi:hypothetical protein